MTNETRKTLVLLKAQLAACEEAARRFAALKDTLQQSASGGAMTESTAEAERSLAAVRSLARQQEDLLVQAQAANLADIIDREFFTLLPCGMTNCAPRCRSAESSSSRAQTLSIIS